MSDTYSGASQLTGQPSALAAPSVLAPTTLANPDLDRIDRNFRRVTALEQATRLPALPDLVKMDLISAPGADEDSLTELLLGLDDAYSRRVSTTPQGGDPAASSYAAPGQADRSDQSGVDQTRIIIAALAGQPQRRRVSVDATRQFKRRAIERGMLDEDPHSVDNSWSPEFNRMRNDMAFDDLNDQMRGAHPGATTFSRAMNILGEFTSPAGLLHMATELDLFWDIGAIGHEISTWGDKWRAVGKAKNPLDFGGKLIDALTGPIDDIVFPVVNDVLLFTGLGAIANSARVGWEGARLLETGGMFSRLFEGSGTVGRFYDLIGSGAGRNLIEMRNPSLVSGLLRRGGGVLEGAGDALAAWRNLTPVVASKQVLQTGMRLGFAAAVENRVPGYNSDGFSISDVPGGTAVGNSLQNAEMALAGGVMGALGPNYGGIIGAGVVTTGLELMFAPYNMFSPGTFFRHGNEGLGLLSSTGRAGVGALGTAGGRAVVGAGAGALAGAIGGDSTEATLEGAAAGAAIGAGLPLAGRLLEAQRFRAGLIGGAAVTGGGLLLGEDPRVALVTGALAGAGIAYLPSNVLTAVTNQAGIHAVDKMLEGAGQRMVRTSFRMIERDQHATVGFYNAVRRSMLRTPDDLAAWDANVRNVGVQQAWADLKYGGDVEMASADMTWEYGSFAIHFIASKQADAVGGGFENFNMARNKLIGQLVPIDIAETRPVGDIVDDVASRMAWQEHGGIGGDRMKVRARQEEIRETLSVDPEQALRLAEEHNKQAGGTIAQLWDPRNFPDAEYVPRRQRAYPEWEQVSWKDRGEAFTEHVGKHLDQIGGYGKWTPATESIRQGRAAGLFDDVSVMPSIDRYGREVDPYTRKPPRDPQTVAVNQAVDDILIGRTSVEPATVVTPPTDPTIKPASVPDDAWRFVENEVMAPGDLFANPVARSEQEYTIAKNYVEDHLGGQVDEEFADKLEGVHSMTNDEFDTFVGQVDDMLGDDFKAFWNWRDNAPKELGAGTAAPAPPPSAAAAAAPAGPRALTPDEVAAGWGDIHTPTAAEVQAAQDIATQARAAGATDWEWYAPHKVGANPNRLGPIQLPKGTPAPAGYYNTTAPFGPTKLGQDLGIARLGTGTAAGGSGRMGVANDLWDLGYRDASEVTATGLTPDEIVTRGVKPAAATPAAVAPAAPAARRAVDPARLPTVSPLAGATEAGRVTPGRADQLWKHDLDTWANKIDDVVEAAKYLREAQAKNWSSALDLSRLDDQFAAARVGGESVTDRQLVEMAQQAAKNGVNRKSVKRLLAFAKRHNVPVASLDTTLRKMADDLVNDAAWEARGFGRIVTDESGRTLEGVDALARRSKQLREKAQQTASKLDLDAMIARAEARGAGFVDSHDFSWAAEHPIGSPVSPDPGVVARRQAAQEFIDLPDDALVTVYHSTSKANAERLIAERTIDPTMAGSNTGSTLPRAGELYVGGMFESGGYGDTTLAITVRKGDIHPSAEAGDYRDAEWYGEFGADAPVTQGLFLLRNQGAALKDLNDVADIRIATEGGSVRVGKPSTEAADLRQLRDGLAEHGYVAVHGTQFLMPEDLSFNTPTFTDVTRRHMNAVTHGNWFGRRPPIEAQILDDRRRRIALAEEFAKVGKDLSPEDETFTHILARLESALRAEQDQVARSLNTAHEQAGLGVRTLERLKSSFTPVRLDDLGGFRRGTPARVKEALETMNLPPEQEQAVVRAITNFRNTDFQDMGLFAIEQYLRTKSVPAGMLKMLGGTKYGSRVIGRASRQAITGGAVGGALGAVTAGSEASFEDRLKAALTGGAVGAAAGGALALGVGKLDEATDIIQRAEDWRYGYLADGYARLRDSMRFTMSPFFDLSRYTEGMMLAQTAAPLRDARTGERLVMPLNASPSALRGRLAKEAIAKARADGETLSSVAAKEAADNAYNRWMGEFKSATKAAKDFDVDAIDSAGHWFRQVGVLGFSPTDWMATAYTNMRGTGMSAETAYHTAREMYQYGTRGRSAAEMSVNFIFFPFSFQKKALTHIGKWLNDDLGRSIILHDALKTYEVLDKRYNLNEMWHDHLPFLTQLGRLNLFAYGISPGQLGGINSQLFQTAGAAIHAFLPVGVNINDSSFAEELIGTSRQHDAGRIGGLAGQMLPVWNDINWMMHDVQEVIVPELRAGAQRVAGVETPMAMESYRAQVQDGWDEFNAYRTDFEGMLASEGYSVSDVLNGNKDWLLPLKDEYERKVDELATRYPAWWASRLDAPGNAIAIGMEKDQRIDNVRFALQDGRPTSVDDLMTAQMQEYIDSVRSDVELALGENDLEAMPPQAWDAIRQMAANFVGTNPHFERLWDRFWGRQFGPLTTPMELNG